MGLLIALPLSTAQANANNTDHYTQEGTRQYVGVAGSWLRTDSDRNIDRDAGGYGVFYGRQISDHLWWETGLDFFKMGTDLPNDSDYYQYHLMTGLAWAFGDRRGLTPYAIMQIGAIKHEVLPTGDNDTNFGANAGLGLVTGSLFDNGMKIRLDARYVYDTFDGARATNSVDDGDFGDIRVSLGLEFPLGRTRVIEHTNTIVKTKTVPVKVETVFHDSDGDSIGDKVDQCPDTPQGVRVDATGCLIANQRFVLKNLLFELNSSRLTVDSRTSLRKVANALASHDEINVEVSGYTDSSGSASYNKDLSKQRAKSVRDFLVSEGVPASRITYKGYGETDPIASNDTVSGRALNRRVELHLSESK